MSKKLWFPVWLVLVSAIPSGVFAQTVLNLPRVVSTADLFTGVAIGNPTPAEVTVTFTAYQADGTPFSGVINPVTLTIPAAGQIAQSFSDLFATKAPFNGWVQVTSAASGLTGFFLNSNYALTDFDGSVAPDPAAEFTLPLAASDGTSITEVTLVNLNADPAIATLTLYGWDGHPLSTANTSLTGRGLIRQTLTDLFGGSVDMTSASHIHVNADRPIVGYAVVVNYLVSGNSVRRETASVSGQGMTPATSYVLPGFVTGGGWLSLLGVVNGAGVSQQITLTAYKEDGTLWNTASNPARILLGGNSGWRTTVGELFGFTDDTLRTGWIQVTGSVGFLSSYVASGNTATPSFALVTGTDASSASRYAAFSQVAEGAGLFTSLSVVNPGTSPANLELYALRPDGSLVGKSTFTLGPNQRTGGRLHELLPASLNQVGGWTFLRSSQPIVGSALLGTLNGAALSGIPPQPAPSTFQPPDQTTAAITGSALAGNQGIGGVQMKLSGPVMTTTTTDDQGRYLFTQLPAGNYQVTPALPGAQFSPVLQGVTLGLQNADGIDFQVGGLQPADVPQIQIISPASTLAGSGSFSIRVLGNNFTPASLISINGQKLDTVFVDRTELRAVLPSSLSAQPGKLTVSVVTPPPGGGSSASMDFTVVAAPQDPLIAGRTAAGAFPSGVAIDNTRNAALVTNQSGDNVSVVDLNSMQILTEIPAGRSPAEGIAIDKVNDVAVVANPGSDNVTVIDLKTNNVTATIPVGSFPIGVAIDAQKKRALVVNGEADKVTLVDLNTLSASGSIPVGSRPAGIAINPKTNQAVVTNRGANTVTVIDLSSDTVLGSIGVGSYPRGVAINPETNQAVVVNANGGTVSIVDLSTRAVVATVNVGVGPTGVAIHALTNSAIVTNSGVSGGSTALPAQTTVSIISLTSQTVVATVPVGSAAFGVDVHQGNQVAVVADYGSNDITLVRIPNPKPRVDDVQPKVIPTGGASLTVTVTGAGFLPTSAVTLNGQPLPTTYVSSTQLRAEISGTLLTQALQGGVVLSHASRLEDSRSPMFAAAAPPQLTIAVSNPGPGGGDSGNPSGANQLQVQNPVPVLLSMSPTSIQADRDLTLVLNGNNFNVTSIVNFGGAQFSPASASPTSIIVSIPHDQLKAGAVPVSVTNPPLGGGTSSPLTFRVDDRQNPAPLVLSVTPPSAPSGSGALTVTVQGTGFIDLAQASLAGAAGTVSGDTIRFNLTADQTQNAGTLTGVITNPSPGGGSATFSFSVLNAVPVVTGYTPASAVTGTAVTLTVNGSNFARASVITIEGTRISTTFVSTTSLTAVIPETFMRIAGQVQIGVTNPPPGGGSVAAGPFSITNPRPALTAVSPASVTIQSTDLSVQLTGTGFTGNSVASISGAPISTTYNSATSLTATIPGRLLQQTGVLPILVTNPPPGGGASDPVSLPVLNPVPVIAGVDPAQLSGDQQNAVLTVTGQNFVNGATILIGKQTLHTTFVSATQLTAPLPPPLPLGRQTITVVNPTPGGGTSNEFAIQIRALKPAISEVNPVRAFPGQTISVIGTNFGVGSILLLRGVALSSTTVTSSAALTALIPIDASTGPADVTIQNPATSLDPALTSAPFTIQIVNPIPVITSLDPATAQVLQTAPVTIHGSAFLPSSQVILNSQSAATSFVDTQTLTFSMPAGISAGSVSVTVINPQPGGGTSNSATLTVTNPTPKLISLNPPTSEAGSTTGLIVTGMNFVRGAFINFGDSEIQTMFIDSNTLSSNLTIGETAGSVSVTVTNPGGATSNALTFTVIPRPSPPPPPPAPTCATFPSGVTPFDSVSYITPPNAGGDRLVVGASSSWSLMGVSLPGQPNQQYCDFVQLASGLSVTAYVPTADERNGIFAAFNGQFPNGIIPSGFHAWRISSVAPPTLSQITPSSGVAGQMVNVTLTGTNFVPGAISVSANGTGQGRGLGIVSMSPTSITGTVVLLGPAGSSGITVSTFAGTSAPVTFTINPNGLNTAGFAVSTFAGSAHLSGSTDAMGTNARFSSIGGLAGDGSGNLLVADSNNNTIRQVVLATQVVSTFTTVAGSAQTSNLAAGPPANFSNPQGIWSDGTNLYIADTNNSAIRKMVLGTGVVTTLVSSGIFTSPSGVWGDGQSLYVTDAGDHTIRSVDIATGITHVIAGVRNSPGSVDGPQFTSTFNQPQGIWGGHHNLYVSDSGNHTIRMISMGQVSTIAGSVGACNLIDDVGSHANFCYPQGLWGDGTQLFIADAGNYAIRSLQLSTGTVVTVAGSGSSGSVDGFGKAAQFCSPSAIWGDGTSLYVADSGNDTIRRLTPAAPTITSITPSTITQGRVINGTIAGTNFSSDATVTVSGNGLSASSVTVQSPTSITVTFTATTGAAPGPRSVSVMTGAGSATTTLNVVVP